MLLLRAIDASLAVAAAPIDVAANSTVMMLLMLPMLVMMMILLH
jgi:hypothetical protein